MKTVYALAGAGAALIVAGLAVCFVQSLLAVLAGVVLMLAGVASLIGAVGLASDPQARAQVQERVREFRSDSPTD